MATCEISQDNSERWQSKAQIEAIYALEGILGSGAAGTVYRVRDRSSGLHYALKVLLYQEGADRNTLTEVLVQCLLGKYEGFIPIPTVEKWWWLGSELPFDLTIQVLDAGKPIYVFILQPLLEGPINKIPISDLPAVIFELTYLFVRMQALGVIHGDISISNVMYVKEDTKRTYIGINMGADLTVLRKYTLAFIDLGETWIDEKSPLYDEQMGTPSNMAYLEQLELSRFTTLLTSLAAMSGKVEIISLVKELIALPINTWLSVMLKSGLFIST